MSNNNRCPRCMLLREMAERAGCHFWDCGFRLNWASRTLVMTTTAMERLMANTKLTAKVWENLRKALLEDRLIISNDAERLRRELFQEYPVTPPEQPEFVIDIHGRRHLVPRHVDWRPYRGVTNQHNSSHYIMEEHYPYPENPHPHWDRLARRFGDERPNTDQVAAMFVEATIIQSPAIWPGDHLLLIERRARKAQPAKPRTGIIRPRDLGPNGDITFTISTISSPFEVRYRNLFEMVYEWRIDHERMEKNNEQRQAPSP